MKDCDCSGPSQKIGDYLYCVKRGRPIEKTREQEEKRSVMTAQRWCNIESVNDSLVNLFESINETIASQGRRIMQLEKKRGMK